MSADTRLLMGEFSRSLDERYRMSLPAELADPFVEAGPNCILVKERPGCLSLWVESVWQAQYSAAVELLQAKLRAGKLRDRGADVQRLGRMLSTRHRVIPLAGRGRLVLPEGFREFLGVEAGGMVLVVGAAVCLELWHEASWREHLGRELPGFSSLFEELTR
ncbi:MAG: division/cell wall cluster transcriptional repressor MraZ [Pirellulales bacterium]|nr:division/cell wall cluster transcriptional repressor MraZ [Pirellulales bacterium]